MQRILESVPPTLEDEPSQAELAAMDALMDLHGTPLLKSLLHAKVINAE